MNRQEKAEFVTWMKGQMEKAPSLVAADYRGLNVVQISALRGRCRESGVSFKVVKNTLMKLALSDSEFAVIGPLLEGPTAVAWHGEDPGAPAKILAAFAKEKGNEALEIKGAATGGKLLSAEEVKNVLATMPSRPELLAQMAGLILAGPQKLHAALSAGTVNLGRLLFALQQKREAAGDQAPAG